MPQDNSVLGPCPSSGILLFMQIWEILRQPRNPNKTEEPQGILLNSGLWEQARTKIVSGIPFPSA